MWKLPPLDPRDPRPSIRQKNTRYPNNPGSGSGPGSWRWQCRVAGGWWAVSILTLVNYRSKNAAAARGAARARGSRATHHPRLPPLPHPPRPARNNGHFLDDRSPSPGPIPGAKVTLRRRHFNPMELALTRAAPHHLGQPEFSFGR
jgi:hypothetical protein